MTCLCIGGAKRFYLEKVDTATVSTRSYSNSRAGSAANDRDGLC